MIVIGARQKCEAAARDWNSNMTGHNGESLDICLAGETYRASSKEFSKNIVYKICIKMVFCEC